MEDYIFSDDGQALIVVDCAIPASETSANKYFLKTLNACMMETEKAFDGISFHSFGAAEIALTNAGQIQRDTLLSSLFPPIKSTEVSITGFSLDLHVLGTPPAFILSQDQTLI